MSSDALDTGRQSRGDQSQSPPHPSESPSLSPLDCPIFKSKGFSAEWIQNFLGHKSYKTTMDMYGTLSIDEMQEIAARLLSLGRTGWLSRSSGPGNYRVSPEFSVPFVFKPLFMKPKPSTQWLAIVTPV